MNASLTSGVVFITAALIFYTIGVWSEKLAGELKGWHLIFFWLGLISDALGTGRMYQISGGVRFNVHGVTGITAIVLMLVHALWASWVLYKKDRAMALKFHRFSVFVWSIWLISFMTGLALAML